MKIKRFKRLFHNTAFHLRDRIVQFSLLCRNDQGWIRNWTTWQYAASLVAVDPESNNCSRPIKALQSSRTKLGRRCAGFLI